MNKNILLSALLTTMLSVLNASRSTSPTKEASKKTIDVMQLEDSLRKLLFNETPEDQKDPVDDSVFGESLTKLLLYGSNQQDRCAADIPLDLAPNYAPDQHTYLTPASPNTNRYRRATQIYNGKQEGALLFELSPAPENSAAPATTIQPSRALTVHESPDHTSDQTLEPKKTEQSQDSADDHEVRKINAIVEAVREDLKDTNEAVVFYVAQKLRQRKPACLKEILPQLSSPTLQKIAKTYPTLRKKIKRVAQHRQEVLKKRIEILRHMR